MSIQAALKGFNYIVHDVSLNETKTDYEILLDSPIVYITNVPIAIDCRINSKENDKFNLTTVQIIKTTPEDPIKALYITTVTTSTDNLQIITSDVDIFSDIGIEDRAVLVDSLGVEYDARDVQQVDGSIVSDQIIGSTTPVEGALDISAYRDVVFVCRSDQDDSLVLQYYGSVDGTDYYPIGSAIAIVDGSVTEQYDIQTVSDPWNYIKAIITMDTGASSGTVEVTYSMKT